MGVTVDPPFPEWRHVNAAWACCELGGSGSAERGVWLEKCSSLKPLWYDLASGTRSRTPAGLERVLGGISESDPGDAGASNPDVFSSILPPCASIDAVDYGIVTNAGALLSPLQLVRSLRFPLARLELGPLFPLDLLTDQPHCGLSLPPFTYLPQHLFYLACDPFGTQPWLPKRPSPRAPTMAMVFENVPSHRPRPPLRLPPNPKTTRSRFER